MVSVVVSMRNVDILLEGDGIRSAGQDCLDGKKILFTYNFGRFSSRLLVASEQIFLQFKIVAVNGRCNRAATLSKLKTDQHLQNVEIVCLDP